jgi:RHS repeat-associated protein
MFSKAPSRRSDSYQLTAALLGSLFLLEACGSDAKKAAPSTTQVVESQCKDGVDNDHDGKVDCDDPDCQSPGGDCNAAPALDRTVVTTVDEAAAFLYTGTNPLQKDADAKAFDVKRVAMLNGTVVDEAGKPLAGVRVSVQGHKEYGYTLTRSDGLYDLAVNGGSRLLLNFTFDGYLPAQRAVQPGWQRHLVVDNLGLVVATGTTTSVSADSGDSQTIAGPSVDDSYGKREPFVIIEPGTSADAVMDDGSTEPLSHLSVTVKEYPLDTSKQFSPGTPVTTTGLAYGINFEVAEATKLGATHVQFSESVSVYVENFLDLPVGTELPLGYYDRAKGQWEKGQTGHVIEILDIKDGAAIVDSNGDGTADDSSTLDGLGITSSDLKHLAQRYKAGDQLWHGKISHFSAYQAQVKVNAPKGSITPIGTGIRRSTLDTPTHRGPVLVEPQSVSQGLPITGTPYALEYQSIRSLAYGASRKLSLPVTTATLPVGLKSITARLTVAGRVFEATLDAKTNQVFPVEWDGKDNFGRLLQGPQPAQLFVGYVYDGVLPSGKKPSTPIAVTLGQNFNIQIGVWDAKAFDLGGFALDVQNAYDPVQHTIFFGNGDQRSAENIALVTKPANLDASFSLGTPDSLFVASDGSLIVTDDQQQSLTAPGRVLKITADGKSSVIAGPGATGDAANAALSQPQGVVAMDDGSLIVADYMQNAIRRIDANGTMTTLISGVTGDNPVVNHTLTSADGIALGPRQELYVVDIDRVLRYEAGTLTTIAGGGTETADGSLATNAQFTEVSSVAAATDGTVYISDRGANKVRKVLADGSIVTIAGAGTVGFSGDGLNATLAELSGPRGLAVGPDGSVYVADQGNGRIRRITPDGLIYTVIGGGKNAPVDGKLATDVLLDQPDGIAVGPDDALYVATMDSVFRVVPGLPALNEKDNLIPSADGRTLYRFDYRGKHLATVDAMTGVTELTFAYDSSGLLSTVADKNGLKTTIKRNSDGSPSSIVGPYGQATGITLSTDGSLAQITDPASRKVTLTWDSATGLLSKVIDPTAKETTFAYDAVGRLTDVRAPTDSANSAGAATDHFDPSITTDGYQSVKATTKGLKVTEYLSRNTTGEAWQRAVKLPDGTRTDWTEAPALFASTAGDGTKVTTYMVPDDAFGPQSMVPSEVDVVLPSGKTLTTYPQRTKKVSDINNVLSLEDWLDEVEVNGRLYANEYHRSDRTLVTTSPVGRTSTTYFDELGRPTGVQAPGMPTVEWTYDNDGRVATVTKTSGSETRTEVRGYGSDGWLSTQKNPLGEQLSYVWDVVGRPKTITRPDSKATAWTFDDADNVTALTPPGRAAHQFAYNPDTKLLTLSTPPTVTQTATSLLAGQQSYTYGNDHELTSITHSDGRSIGFTYSSTGQLTTQTLANATLTYGYDSGGALTSINRSDSVKVAMTHDGSLWTGSTWSGAISGSVKADYDANFWLKTLTVNNASSVTFSYDNDGLLIGASSTAGAMTVARDTNTGMVTGTTLGNVTTANEYNGFAELNVLTTNVSGTYLFGQALERDSLGRITSVTEQLGTTAHDTGYTYDNVGRLSSATRDGVTTKYGYDSNGNRTTVQTGTDAAVTATYDAQDRIVAYGTQQYSFTPHGDLLSRTDGTKTLGLTYDELGNLMSVSLVDGSTTHKIDYVVDGFGRRVARRVDGVFDRAWLYRDGLRPVSEVDAAGVFTHYVYAESQSGAPDFLIRSGVLYRIVKDHLGSVRMVVNATTGAVAQSIEYDAFGRVLSETGAGFQAFGFAGGLYDADTKLVRFGARDYDPGMGRWTNKDPIGFAGGDTDFYAYVGNDPVNLTDPDGEGPVGATWALAKKISPYTRTYRIVKILIDLVFPSREQLEARERLEKACVDGGISLSMCQRLPSGELAGCAGCDASVQSCPPACEHEVGSPAE